MNISEKQLDERLAVRSFGSADHFHTFSCWLIYCNFVITLIFCIQGGVLDKQNKYSGLLGAIINFAKLNYLDSVGLNCAW